jgi:exopolysaccharide biosynthesis polyprenyl glycosylphosphotransferase
VTEHQHPSASRSRANDLEAPADPYLSGEGAAAELEVPFAPRQRWKWGAGSIPGARLRLGRNPERARERPIEDHDGRAQVRRRDALFRRALAAADLLAAALALVVCVNVLGDDSLRPVTLLAVPLVVLVGKLAGLYERDELLVNKSTIDEAPHIFQVATLYTLVVYLLDERVIEGAFGTEQILVLWGALFLFTVVGRLIARKVVKSCTSAERCLFVGSEDSFERLKEKLESSGGSAILVGRTSLKGSATNGLHADPAALHEMIEKLNAHRVVIEPDESNPLATLDFVREAKATGVRVSILPRILEVVGSAMVVEEVNGLTLLGLRRLGLSRSSLAVKRAFDLAGSLLGLLVLSPVLALVAAVIKLGSRGPVFYRQPRVGRDGELFEMLKFRTMVSDADALKVDLLPRNEAGLGFFKIANDPRITRSGRWLRRLCLDELPQLVNVVRGDMSLVGPRPLIVDEDKQVLGLDRHRLHLKPGMTGHWQILGSSRVPLGEMVKLDYLYVAGWTLWADVKILVRTVPYVLARRGI